MTEWRDKEAASLGGAYLPKAGTTWVLWAHRGMIDLLGARAVGVGVEAKERADSGGAAARGAVPAEFTRSDPAPEDLSQEELATGEFVADELAGEEGEHRDESGAGETGIDLGSGTPRVAVMASAREARGLLDGEVTSLVRPVRAPFGGRVAIECGGYVVGEAELVATRGPHLQRDLEWAVEEGSSYADEEVAARDFFWVWEVRGAVGLDCPVPLKKKSWGLWSHMG